VIYDRYGHPHPTRPDPFDLGWEIRHLHGNRFVLFDPEIGERHELNAADKLVQLWCTARALQTEVDKLKHKILDLST